MQLTRFLATILAPGAMLLAICMQSCGDDPTTYFIEYNNNDETHVVPNLWVDGIRQTLEAKGDTYASSVYVLKGKVYVAGKDCEVSCLWVNGVKRTLKIAEGDSYNSYASSVFVAPA